MRHVLVELLTNYELRITSYEKRMKIPIGRYWRLLVNYLRPQWRPVALLAVLLISSITLQLINPQIVRLFIDSAQRGESQTSLLLAALLFIGIAVITQVIMVGATYIGQNVGWTATNELRADLAAHCLNLDIGFHKARTPGEIIERVDGDVNALSNFFSQFMIEVVSNLLLLIGVLALFFREDWRFGLGMSVFAVVALLVLIRLRALATPYWAAMREMSARFYGFLHERLSGTADIRANGAQQYVMYRFTQLLRAWLPLNYRATFAGISMWITAVGVFALGNAIAWSIGAYLWQRGSLTLGSIYLVFHYTQLLQGPLHRIRTQLEDLQRAGASIDRVEELLRTPSALQDGTGLPLPAGALSVEMDDVQFGYEQDDLVLQGITLRLPPGKVLGLLGRTGSGKTSLARLLLRLYDPTAGTICVGGVPLQLAHLRDLRKRVGMVTQEVQLFSASLRDNLTFFNPAVADERIVDVLNDLGLGPWLHTLPDGLDTPLEAGGSGLSAGEAQLVAFARLFLTDPGLVIMDEASSRLDPATERLIERAIDKLLHPQDSKRTAIIIAHRLSTVERADQIMILDGGRVIEYGEREDLAADDGSRFSQLLRTGLQEVLA